uniref:Uncharacterized protein n=1 Tax=Athene cunicularia TaxID=194338 RepID=A0A663LWE0_ATHCN
EVMLLEPCSSLTEGYVGSLHENRHGSSVQIRRRKASGDPYWAYSGDVFSSTCKLPLHTYSLFLPSCHLPVGFALLLCSFPQ